MACNATPATSRAHPRRDSDYRRLFQQLSVLDFLRLHLDVTQRFLDELHAQRIISADQLTRVKSLPWPETRNELLQLLVKKDWTREPYEAFLAVLSRTHKCYVAEFLAARVDDSTEDTSPLQRATPVASTAASPYSSSRLDALLKPLDLCASNEVRLLLRDRETRLARLSAEHTDVCNLLRRRTDELDRLAARNERIEKMLAEWEGEPVVNASGEEARKGIKNGGLESEKEVGERSGRNDNEARRNQWGYGEVSERANNEKGSRGKDTNFSRTKKYVELETSGDGYPPDALSHIQTVLASLKARVAALEMDNSDLETTVSDLSDACKRLAMENAVLAEDKRTMREKFVRSMEEAKRSPPSSHHIATPSTESSIHIRVDLTEENPDPESSSVIGSSRGTTPEKSTNPAVPASRAKRLLLAAERADAQGHVRKHSDVTRPVVPPAEAQRRCSVPARPAAGSSTGGGAKQHKA